MRAYYSDVFDLSLPDGHRFPMRRYPLLRERVSGMPGLELCLPPSATPQDLLRAHTADYVEKATQGQLDRLEQRRLGFPWSPALVVRSLASVGATCAAARDSWGLRCAGQWGAAVNLAGGTHHAFADRGEGFCLFNDCVVAARSLQAAFPGQVQQMALIDVDVHQGNGSASLCREDPSIFTFSLHGRQNYPFHKEISDCDVELEDGCGDEDYLRALGVGLEAVWRVRPQLIFYLAGADPYEKDRLGRLRVTREGLRQRDRLVFQECFRRQIAVVVTMAGGYAEPIEDTAQIQAATVEECLALART